MRGTSSTRPSAPSAAAIAAFASSESSVRVTTVWGRTTPAVNGSTGRARVSSSAMSGGSIRDVSADDSTLEPLGLFPTTRLGFCDARPPSPRPSGRQLGLDGAHEGGVLRLDGGAEPAHDLARRAHEELLEVPADV